MLSHDVRLIRLSAIIFMVGVLTSCTLTIQSSEFPQLQNGSPLKGVPPKTFAFKEFKDTRMTMDPLFMVRSMSLAEVRLDQPPSTVASMAIRKEFERNGHRCIDYSPQSKADFIVEGTVFKYWLSLETEFSISTATGNVGVKLRISSVPNDKLLFIRNYEGMFSRTIATDYALKEILSQAQLAMIRQISSDPELIEFLDK